MDESRDDQDINVIINEIDVIITITTCFFHVTFFINLRYIAKLHNFNHLYF